MNIIYASSDSYAEIMAVSIVSLCENNMSEEQIHFYIISNGISKKNKKNILQTVNKYGRKLSFFDAPDLNNYTNVNIDFKQHNIITFARLFIADFFPELDRAIFIDCDTLVLGSLKSLWNTEFESGKSCAGVLDAISAYNKKRIGLSPDDIYINAGVILVDLEKWRKGKYSRLFMEYLRRHGGTVPLVDQGVLNGTLSRQLQVLDPEYNFMTFGFAFSYREIKRYKKFCHYYSAEEFEKARNHITIAHATSHFLIDRPWIENSNYPLQKKWMQYRKLTAWEKQGLWKNTQKKYVAVLRSMMKIPFLRMLLIELLGIVQATMKG